MRSQTLTRALLNLLMDRFFLDILLWLDAWLFVSLKASSADDVERVAFSTLL